MKKVRQNETMRLFAPYDPADNNFTLTNKTTEIIEQLQKEYPSLDENEFMGHLIQRFLDYTNAVTEEDKIALSDILTSDFASVHQAPAGMIKVPNIEFAYLNDYQNGDLVMILVIDNGTANPLTHQEQHYFLDFVKECDVWKLDDCQLLDFSIGLDI